MMSNGVADVGLKRKRDAFEDSSHNAKSTYEAPTDAKRLKTSGYSIKEQQSTVANVPRNGESHPDATTIQKSDERPQSDSLILPDDSCPSDTQQPKPDVQQLQARNNSQKPPPLSLPKATAIDSMPVTVPKAVMKENIDETEVQKGQEQQGAETNTEEVEDEPAGNTQAVEQHALTSNAPHTDIDVTKFAAKTLLPRSSEAFRIIHKRGRLPATTKWQNCLPRRTITNNAGQVFNTGDVVAVTYDLPPHGVGKIVEIREGSEPVAVVQWLYDLAEAKAAAAAVGARVQNWPSGQGLRLESDHFDLVFGANLRNLPQQPVVNGEMFWNSGTAKVADLRKLQEKMTTQLG